jgi:hypothetical protein
MKKIFISLFIILAITTPLFLGIQKKTEAVVQKIESISLIKSDKSSSNKWNWEFNIVTSGTTDTSKMVIDIYKGRTKVFSEQKDIRSNFLDYITGYQLEDNTTYNIFFGIARSNPVAQKMYTGKTGTAGQNTSPIITSIDPINGIISTTTTITGSSFTGATEVSIGSTKVSDFRFIDDSKIAFEIPEGSTNGKITVKTPNGQAVSSQIFIIKTIDDEIKITGDEIATTSTEYNLLAPIGTLTQAPKNIGEYFNIIFKIAIGLCAVLAVIMIVIGGVQYMGDESIFGKTEAKKSITSAILGLIIALGSYALLNTINPDLLGRGGVNIGQVSAGIEEEDVPLTSNDVFVSGQKTEECTSGIINANTINGNIPTCGTLKTNIEKLILDANKAGYKIFGYGYRSKEKQEKLREKNCGGKSNIYNINAKCNPLTAYPGKSRHENGLAVDFTCDGSTIRSRDNKCFIWLKNNANKSEYGELKNLQKEPWHWSIDGK